MDDEAQRKPKPAYLPGQPLDELSVDEIGEIIAMLEEDILRLKQAMDGKKSHLSAAEELFRI